MSDFQARRVRSDYAQTIAAPASEIFPLLCPVREHDWIDGWTCRMIYAESGVAENNCIFTTSFPRGMEETWVVSHYDPVNFVIQFVVINPEMYVLKFDISLQAEGETSARMRCANTITGLTDKGNAFIAGYTNEAEAERMGLLFKTLDHYCRTGKMFKRSALLGALHAALHRG
jgi:hypothetical protein